MIELFGLLLPPLIDLINKKINLEYIRFWTSVIVCGIVGYVLCYIQTDGFDGFYKMTQYADSISKSIIMTFGLAQLSFGAYWKETKAHKALRGD